MTVTTWQTTDVDCAIAEEFFGWKWMAFDAASHPQSDPPQIVRRFMFPDQLESPEWIEFFREQHGHPADGTESIDDTALTNVPHFSGHEIEIAHVERELRWRHLWHEYRDQLWAQIGGTGPIDESRLADAGCEDRCIAALAVVGSKFVKPDLRSAYLAVLGGVSACSPEHYGAALQRIAGMVGREKDESVRADVRAIQKSLPSYED